MRGLTPGPSKLPSLTKSKLKKPGEAIPTVTERPVAREPNVFLRTKTFGKLQAVGSSKESPSPNTKRRQFQRNTPRRHTLAIAKNEKKDGKGEPSAEQVRNAFRDMLSKRFPRPDRSDGGSTGSEDGQTSGPPARPAPGKRHPVRRRTTVVTYNPDSSRSTDQDDRNTSLSEVESEGSIQGHGLQRGGPLRSSLPIVRSPNQSFDRSLGLVFLVYGDETKRCVLPNEITHLDTVRALFVQCFHDKLNMPLLESRPQLKIYIQDSKTRVFYQLEDLRDIEEHSILKLHYCDSTRPQKVKEYPKSRGKTILSPPPPVKSASPPVNKPPGGSTDPQSSMQTRSLPNRNFLDPASQQMRDHPDIRYRPLTPDVAHTSPDARWRQVAVDDHRRMLPERPFSPDRLALGTIPENRQSSPANRKHSSPRDPARSRSAQSTPVPMMEVMVPSSGRSTPTPSLQPQQYSSAKYRPLSPTPEPVSRNAPLLPHRSPPRHYSRDPAAGYHSDGSPQVKQGPVFPPQTQMYVAKGVRATTCTFTSPQRATGPPKNHQPLPHPQQPAPQQQPLPRDTRDPLIERGNPRDPLVDRGNPRHSLSYAPVAGMPPIHRQPMTRSLQERGEGPRRPHNLGPPTSVSDGQICQRSQSYRVPGDRSDMRIRPRSVTPQPQDFDPESRFRIEKMEAQLANLTAWVHSTVSTNGSAETGSRTGSLRSLQSSSTKSSASSNSLNDLSTVSKHTQTLIQSTPLTIPKELANGLLLLHKRTIELKVELKGLRRLQQLNLEGAKESIDEVYGKIKIAMTTVPGVNNKPVRQKRFEVDTNYDTFKLDKEKVQRELRDLESSVEEMRGDVISRQCRVNMSEVEAMALSLSQITKSLADLKGRLPPLIDSMKSVMSGEMEIVVGEERFVKEEPESIESCLKKCKKLTGTLFTMKRLASVQEQRPPQIPVISTNGQTTSDKLNVLENIQSVVPNHDARLQSLEAADASRERKKRLASQQEALKFEKKLELATKNLKSGPGKSGSDSERSTPESEGMPVIQATQSSEKINNLGNTKVISRSKSLDQDNDLDDPDSLLSQKQAARAEFFRSLSSTPPKTSPQKSPNRDYEVLIPKSQANASSPQEMTRSTPELSSPASPSVSKLPIVTAQITQPEQSAVSSAQPESVVSSRKEPQPGTPTPAQRSVPKTNRGEKYDKRRLPPPPPPRSSVKTSGQSQPSFSSFYSTITSPSKLDDSSADNINANFKSSRMVGGPISSTPLVGGPKKPANNFEKGIMNVYVNVHQSAEGKNPENRHVLRSNVIESPSDNGNDQESEAESTSSVDSQNEVWRLRAAAKGQSSGSVHGLPKPDLKHTEELKTVLARKKPPPPPQRKSSVLSRRDLKEQTTKTHHLQDQHNRLGKVESEQGHLSKQHQILEDEQKQLAKAKKKP